MKPRQTEKSSQKECLSHTRQREQQRQRILIVAGVLF